MGQEGPEGQRCAASPSAVGCRSGSAGTLGVGAGQGPGRSRPSFSTAPGVITARGRPQAAQVFTRGKKQACPPGQVHACRYHLHTPPAKELVRGKPATVPLAVGCARALTVVQSEDAWTRPEGERNKQENSQCVRLCLWTGLCQALLAGCGGAAVRPPGASSHARGAPSSLSFGGVSSLASLLSQLDQAEEEECCIGAHCPGASFQDQRVLGAHLQAQ